MYLSFIMNRTAQHGGSIPFKFREKHLPQQPFPQLRCAYLIGTRHDTEPPAVNNHHITITISPRAAREVQNRPTHILVSPRSLRRDLLFRKDAIANEPRGHLGRENYCDRSHLAFSSGEGTGRGQLTSRSDNISPDPIRDKIRRHLLHQQRRCRLTLPVGVAAGYFPVESSDAAGGDDLAFLLDVSLFVTRVE